MCDSFNGKMTYRVRCMVIVEFTDRPRKNVNRLQINHRIAFIQRGVRDVFISR